MRLGRVVDYRASARRARAGLGCWRLVLLGVLAAVLAGCGSARWSTTTESRGGDGTGRVITGSSYKVRAGDTVHVITRRAGIDSRRIVEWNQLSSPDGIYVGTGEGRRSAGQRLFGVARSRRSGGGRAGPLGRPVQGNRARDSRRRRLKWQ